MSAYAYNVTAWVRAISARWANSIWKSAGAVKQNSRLLHRPTTWTVPPGAWSRGNRGIATQLTGRTRSVASGYTTSPLSPWPCRETLDRAIGADSSLLFNAERTVPAGKVEGHLDETRYLSPLRYQVPELEGSRHALPN